jgi:hypothetical protein
MTTYMQCLGCGTVVVNPKIINFMYEKCNYCTQVQREQEERAIDTYLHQQAEKELEKNV